MHEADRELKLASDFRCETALFQNDGERFLGVTDREAIFAAVKARLARQRHEGESVSQPRCGSDERDSVKELISKDEEDDGEDEQGDDEETDECGVPLRRGRAG